MQVTLPPPPTSHPTTPPSPPPNPTPTPHPILQPQKHPERHDLRLGHSQPQQTCSGRNACGGCLALPPHSSHKPQLLWRAPATATVGGEKAKDGTGNSIGNSLILKSL